MKIPNFSLKYSSLIGAPTLESVYVEILQLHLKHGVALYCSSTAWDKKQNKLVSARQVKSRFYLGMYNFIAFLTTIRSIVMIYNSGTELSESGGVATYQLVFMLVFTFVLCINWFAALHFGQESVRTEGCLMLNQLLKYGKHNAEPLGSNNTKCLNKLMKKLTLMN